MQVEVLGGRAAWFSGVRVSIKKVDRENRSQVRTEFRNLRPVSVTYPVAVHLKDLCHL